MVSATVRQSAKATYDKLMGFVGPGRMGPVILALLVDILGMIELFSKNNTNFNFHDHVSGNDTTGKVFWVPVFEGANVLLSPAGDALCMLYRYVESANCLMAAARPLLALRTEPSADAVEALLLGRPMAGVNGEGSGAVYKSAGKTLTRRAGASAGSSGSAGSGGDTTRRGRALKAQMRRARWVSVTAAGRTSAAEATTTACAGAAGAAVAAGAVFGGGGAPIALPSPASADLSRSQAAAAAVLAATEAEDAPAASTTAPAAAATTAATAAGAFQDGDDVTPATGLSSSGEDEDTDGSSSFSSAEDEDGQQLQRRSRVGPRRRRGWVPTAPVQAFPPADYIPNAAAKGLLKTMFDSSSDFLTRLRHALTKGNTALAAGMSVRRRRLCISWWPRQASRDAPWPRGVIVDKWMLEAARVKCASKLTTSSVRAVLPRATLQREATVEQRVAEFPLLAGMSQDAHLAMSNCIYGFSEKPLLSVSARTPQLGTLSGLRAVPRTAPTLAQHGKQQADHRRPGQKVSGGPRRPAGWVAKGSPQATPMTRLAPEELLAPLPPDHPAAVRAASAADTALASAAATASVASPSPTATASSQSAAIRAALMARAGKGKAIDRTSGTVQVSGAATAGAAGKRNAEVKTSAAVKCKAVANTSAAGRPSAASNTSAAVKCKAAGNTSAAGRPSAASNTNAAVKMRAAGNKNAADNTSAAGNTAGSTSAADKVRAAGNTSTAVKKSTVVKTSPAVKTSTAGKTRATVKTSTAVKTSSTAVKTSAAVNTSAEAKTREAGNTSAAVKLSVAGNTSIKAKTSSAPA